MINKSNSNIADKLSLKAQDNYKRFQEQLEKQFPDQSLSEELLILYSNMLSRSADNYLDYVSEESKCNLVKEIYEKFLSYVSTASKHGDPKVEDISAVPNTVLAILKDSSFIVASVNEYLRVNRFLQPVISHPVLTLEAFGYSLVILTIKEQNRLSELKTEMLATLEKVRHVNSDFELMVETINDFSSKLANTEYQSLSSALCSGEFVLLGTREWKYQKKEGLVCLESRNSGFFSSSQFGITKQLRDIDYDVEHVIKTGKDFYYSKYPILAPVYHSEFLDLIIFKFSNDEADYFIAIIGIFGAKLSNQEASDLPIIRQYATKIFEDKGYGVGSYLYTQVTAILNSLPLSILYSLQYEELKDFVIDQIDYELSGELVVKVAKDQLNRFVFATVVCPSKKYSEAVRLRIQEVLVERLGAVNDILDYHLIVSDLPYVIVSFLVPIFNSLKSNFNIEEIQQEIRAITVSWEEQLLQKLCERHGKIEGQSIFNRFGGSISPAYRAGHQPEDAVNDLEAITKLGASNPIAVSLNHFFDNQIGEEYIKEESFQLKIYKYGEKFTLSYLFPFIDNFGLDILDEQIIVFKDLEGVQRSIYSLTVKPKISVQLDENLNSLVVGLTQAISNKLQSDILNSLIIESGLKIQEVVLVRAMISYLMQIKQLDSEKVAIDAFKLYPLLTKRVVSFFNTKFGSNLEKELIRRELVDIQKDIFSHLRSVKKGVHEKFFKQILNIFEAIVRTNFFKSKRSEALSFKIDCGLILNMPKPIPLYETFVFGKSVEGVHLRNGRVARGGIRYSDRLEDYRTEVLGLMRTQVVKNSIIVPTGAKGGFIVKMQNPTPEDAKECYRIFIRGLLDLADNQIDSKIVRPEQCICYDQDDHYLVVAADKGTAAYSDTANKVAVDEYNFWLQDAFASGGSNGYDHKKLGITARGAWEAARKHFIELGIDPENEEFTAAGIGDMSGDVFGNGLLLSSKVKLVAAFDHRHIFIDPNPDLQKSFNERQRLFELPKSSWKDYDEAVISKGGGVFLRESKEIVLSPEAKESLSIQDAKISGDDLIKAILKAPVVMLWNGGIGTYVKSSSEENISVGDKNNDAVRINANDLRAKLIVEGGNLGLTQKARIEYAKIGGRINTDAVDNSGGVNLSDNEVNIKILLGVATAANKLNYPDRNKLLADITNDVVKNVVSRNKWQSGALSLMQEDSSRNIKRYGELIKFYEKEGLLNPAFENLPDQKELLDLDRTKKGLTRPELAILMAYSKIYIYDRLKFSDLPTDSYFNDLLYSYFPEQLRERFREEILIHPLKDRIIATEVASLIVDRIGPYYIQLQSERLGVRADLLVKCFFVAYDLLDAAKIYQELSFLNKPQTATLYRTYITDLGEALRVLSRKIFSFIHNEKLHNKKIVEISSKIKPALINIFENAEKCFIDEDVARYQESKKTLYDNGLSEFAASRLAALVPIRIFFEAAVSSSETNLPPVDLALVFAKLNGQLLLRRFLSQVATYPQNDFWDGTALQHLEDDLRRVRFLLALQYIDRLKADPNLSLKNFLLSKGGNFEVYQRLISELPSRHITLQDLMTITRQLVALI